MGSCSDFLVRGWIDGQSGLFELRGELGGLDHFEHADLRRGEENVEGFDVGVESPFLEAGENPLGVVFVVGRADVVRARAQAAHVLFQIGGIGDRAKLRSPIRARSGWSGRIADERSLIGAECHGGDHQIQDQQHVRRSVACKSFPVWDGE